MLHDGIIYLADEKLLVHLFIFNGARVLTSDGYVPIKCNFELILNDNNDYIKLIGKEFDIKFSNLTVSGCKISEHNSNQTIDNLGHIEGRIQQDCSKLFKY